MNTRTSLQMKINRMASIAVASNMMVNSMQGLDRTERIMLKSVAGLLDELGGSLSDFHTSLIEVDTGKEGNWVRMPKGQIVMPGGAA